METLESTRYNNLRNNLESDDACEHERKTLLNDESDEDEDAIFNTSLSESSGKTAQVRDYLNCVRIEMRKVTDVMLDNVEKVMERGQRLDDLETASDRLFIVGAEFQRSAQKARYDGWLQNIFSKYAAYAVMLSIFGILLVTTIIRYS